MAEDIVVKKMILAALSVGDRTSIISSLYPCQNHFLDDDIKRPADMR